MGAVERAKRVLDWFRPEEPAERKVVQASKQALTTTTDVAPAAKKVAAALVSEGKPEAAAQLKTATTKGPSLTVAPEKSRLQIIHDRVEEAKKAAAEAEVRRAELIKNEVAEVMPALNQKLDDMMISQLSEEEPSHAFSRWLELPDSLLDSYDPLGRPEISPALRTILATTIAESLKGVAIGPVRVSIESRLNSLDRREWNAVVEFTIAPSSNE